MTRQSRNISVPICVIRGELFFYYENHKKHERGDLSNLRSLSTFVANALCLTVRRRFLYLKQKTSVSFMLKAFSLSYLRASVSSAVKDRIQKVDSNAGLL